MAYALGTTSIFTLNSKNRIDNGNNPALARHSIQLPNGNLYDRVVMLSASIPYTYYQVLNYIGSTSNEGNLLQIRVNADNYMYYIPVGNYTRHGIANKLQELIRADFPTATVTYPYDTGGTQDGKLTFSIPNAGLDEITVAVTDDTSYYIRELIGFHNPYTGYWRSSRDYLLNDEVIHNNTRYRCVLAHTDQKPPSAFWTSSYISSIYFTNNANPAVIKSPNPIHTKIPATLFILSDVIKSEIDNYVLQQIEVRDEGHFGQITYNQPDPYGNSKELSYRDHKYFDFTMVDSRGKSIDLNGLDYTITIMFFRHNPIALFQLEQIRIENTAELLKQQQKVEKQLQEEEQQTAEDLKKEEEKIKLQESIDQKKDLQALES